MARTNGKVAMITGSASGIGRGIAESFARTGIAVIIVDIDPVNGEKAAAEIRSAGGRAVAVRTDVSKASDVRAAVKKAIDEFGKVDILVNDAAYLGFSTDHEPFAETDDREWDKNINVTFKGVLYTCKEVIPHMRAQKWGRIINITSDSAKAMAPRGEALYSACKSAVAGFSRALAGELARDNILVNCIAPGFTMTPSAQKTRPQEWVDKVTAAIPLHRPGEPEDIAGMALFLASEEARQITGQHFSVNGGMLMTN